MTISLSIAGLHAHAAGGPWRAGPRSAIEWAASLGFRSIQLDATAPGLRPRELDRSARRDLAATLRRHGLGLTGLDLWIPREHFADPATSERALEALSGAIGLASELAGLCSAGGVVVSAMLPADVPELLSATIAERAGAAGALVEDHTRREPPEEAGGPVRPGLDTARVILRGDEPGTRFAQFAASLASLRLNDADDTGRRPVGRGRLEIGTMRALHTTLTPSLAVVTDLRGLADPALGAAAAIDVWRAGSL